MVDLKDVIISIVVLGVLVLVGFYYTGLILLSPIVSKDLEEDNSIKIGKLNVTKLNAIKIFLVLTWIVNILNFLLIIFGIKTIYKLTK